MTDTFREVGLNICIARRPLCICCALKLCVLYVILNAMQVVYAGLCYCDRLTFSTWIMSD